MVSFKKLRLISEEASVTPLYVKSHFSENTAKMIFLYFTIILLLFTKKDWQQIM